MEFDSKRAHRQSRAPWLNQTGHRAPSVASSRHGERRGDSPPRSILSAANRVRNLAIADSNPANRRLSIHASAMHGRTFSHSMDHAPPLPVDNIGNEGPYANIANEIANNANASASEIDDLYNKLLGYKRDISADISANITQNQKNILQLTNDLKKTQDELVALRVTAKDIFEVMEFFAEAANRKLDWADENGSERSSVSKKRDRSSVIAVEKMWSSHMQSLFKHVDGALKLVPVVPGRHILAESGRWFQINVGTWKPMSPAHIFVFNDMLLLATKKAGADKNQKQRLQATHCWRLDRVRVAQVHPPHKTGGQDEYYISVTSENLTFTYSTDRIDHFLKIVDAYKRGTNEVMHQNRAAAALTFESLADETRDEKRQLRDLVRNLNSLRHLATGRNLGLFDPIGPLESTLSINRSSGDGMLHDISARVHSRNRSHDYGKRQPSTINDKNHFFTDLKQLEDKLDDVDIVIAHNDVNKAVGYIGQIEARLSAIDTAVAQNVSSLKSRSQSETGDDSHDEARLLIDVIRLKINLRKLKVQEDLAFELQHGIGRLTEENIADIMACFDSFGELPKGIRAYLDAVAQHLAATVTRLIVGAQGLTKIDVVNYLLNLVVIYVAILKRVVLTYNHKIRQIVASDQLSLVDSSGLVKWCVDQVTKLVAQVKKHLHGTFLATTGINPDTDEPIQHIKDPRLFENFRRVLLAQLDELKTVGINVDYMFLEILALA